MCINDKGWHSGSKCPVFGETCTVEKSFTSPSSGEPVYSFLEYPTEPPYLYRCFYQNRFVPLSDIDECELVNTKEECV